MDIESFLTSSKWDILTELSKNQKSPLELAKIFNTSVANMSQQLKLMEATGVISKIKIPNKDKGKPRIRYYIKDETYYLLRLGKSFAVKQTIKPEPCVAFTLNAISKLPKKDHHFMLKFFWGNVDLLADSSVGVFKNTDKSLELFVVSEKLEEVRKRISNVDIANNQGLTKRMICWSHNNIEVTNGIKNKDFHFLNLIKESEILFDNKGALERYKESVVGL